ncbi:hypothetical protein CK203_078774 [Vitis vinifera]|uniref:PB1 domain-containing protein n=1 Tax=Vitis vinifera TaxID=29760 RepID=A0A438F7K8_VITVI|nr:hypothetical protein CK203_078774 [Vitis vinifera]
MAAKKVIAICQSGGEFVTNKDGSLSYNGGEAYAIDVDQQTQLSDFKLEVAEMFNCSIDTMSIKYFLPDNKKTLITISKDKDLKRMAHVVQDAYFRVQFGAQLHTMVRFLSGSWCDARSSRTTVSEAVVPAVAPVDAVVDMTHAIDKVDMDMANYTHSDNAPVISNDDKHQKAAQQWENTITGVDQSHRVTVKCKSQGCPWRIYASRLSTTQLICIKKMHTTHTCEGAIVKAGYRATRGWVGTIIKEKLKVSPNYKPKDIADDIKREYGIQLNYSQAWRAKEIAREQLQGSYKEAYSQLPFFCEKIKETNPGSFATFETKEDSSFHRLFISFHAAISGFQQGCRPLLFLDSTPLNSKYQGMLLTATAADGDDGVFPVAFAVVDAETDDNWSWFLLELKSAVSTARPITFVADFQKGLKKSLAEIFDNGYHSYCLRYLTEKLNKDLKGQFSHEARRFMINDFYAAAYASRLETFQRCTENIKGISPEAYIGSYRASQTIGLMHSLEEQDWQLSGLPCCHAIAVFEWIGRNPYDYCSRYFTVESYRLTYAESIHPVPNVDRPVKTESTQVGIIVTPPPTKRPPGRPKMKQAGSVCAWEPKTLQIIPFARISYPVQMQVNATFLITPISLEIACLHPEKSSVQELTKNSSSGNLPRSPNENPPSLKPHKSFPRKLSSLLPPDLEKFLTGWKMPTVVPRRCTLSNLPFPPHQILNLLSFGQGSELHAKIERGEAPHPTFQNLKPLVTFISYCLGIQHVQFSFAFTFSTHNMVGRSYVDSAKAVAILEYCFEKLWYLFPVLCFTASKTGC